MSEEARMLVAGPFEATLEPTGLRWIRWGGVEILRELAVTVRDQAWGTAVPIVTTQSVRRSKAGATVRQTLKFRHADIDLAAGLVIEFDSSGRLRMALRAVARTTFERNRIGLIALHPASVAGSAALFETSGGSISSCFPTSIEPGIVATDVVGMQWRPSRGLELTLEFAGERWEIEDQRNWTDASFKTYPTPLHIPYPAVVAAGTVIEQAATLVISGRSRSIARPRTPDSLDVASGHSARMPAIAAFVPVRSGRSDGDAEAIRALGLGAIRGVVDGDRPGSAQRIADLTELAADSGVSIEIELTVDPVDRSGIANLAAAIASSPAPVSHVFVFDAGSPTGYDSSDAALAAVGGALAGAGIRIDLGGGTRANFTELNRLRPVPTEMAVVTYGINPQVHAFDESSIVETLEILPQTVRQARAITGRRPLSIPVSFRPRVNAGIGRARFGHDEGGPARADPRQPSAFLAAWSLGAVAALARRGVQSLSLFETLGPAGLAETEDGLNTYPVGAVVAALGTLRGAPVRAASTGSAVAISTAGPGGGWILVANLRPDRQRITLTAPWAGEARLRVLRPAPWPGGPEGGWVESRHITFREGRPAVLELGPWQTGHIDSLDVGQAANDEVAPPFRPGRRR